MSGSVAGRVHVRRCARGALLSSSLAQVTVSVAGSHPATLIPRSLPDQPRFPLWDSRLEGFPTEDADRRLQLSVRRRSQDCLPLLPLEVAGGLIAWAMIPVALQTRALVVIVN